MKISYSKLWRLCVERDTNPTNMIINVGSNNQALFKLRNDQTVSLLTIDKICTYFKCQPSDIMEIVEE